MDKREALDLKCEEWEALFEGWKEPRYRASQVCDWIYKKRVLSFDSMTNLSLPLRSRLKEALDLSLPVLIERRQSSRGDAIKYLWKLRDGESVESVVMRYEGRDTACLSTQVGCPLGCSFCATGKSGFVRNLTSGEIVGQFLAMEADIGDSIENAVYMGMGEPFLNLDAVLVSVRKLNHPKMRALGIRHIAISTVGIVSGIKALAHSDLKVRLAVSLHAPNDDLRTHLMPVNASNPLGSLYKALKSFQEITGERISVEYMLISDINDGLSLADELANYLKGLHVYVNLIPYNPTDGLFKRPPRGRVEAFKKRLEGLGYEVALRKGLGADIEAACGQLRRRALI